MKKKALWLPLAALLILLVMSVTASADRIYGGFTIHIGIGETLKIDFPDLSDKIGPGLTKDDFDITYHIEDQYGYIRGTVDENDYLTMNTTSTGSQIIEITYTPKKYGVGKKTVFWANIVVYEPLTSIYVETNDVRLAADEKVEVRYHRSAGSAPDIELTGFDPSIVKATLDDKLYLTAVGVGETDVVIQAYNGVTATVHVTVTNPPTKMEITPEDFVCYTGETIPLDIDLGDGYMNTAPNIGMSRDGSFVWYDDFFLDGNWREIYIAEPGNYKVTMTTYNGHSDSFTFSAYSGENCTVMAITNEWISVGDEYVYIYCYDANGKSIRPKLDITQGSDIARIVGDTLVTTGAGMVTVTATNPDGSTKEVTVEVHEAPTSMKLNASNLKLAVGESFEFEVIFDKGKKDYYFNWSNWGTDEYGLSPITVKGQTVTAQAAGSASVSVHCGTWYTSCDITVVESDKSLLVDRPKGDFNIGQTYQLRVMDKGGNVYPATFRTQYQVSSDTVSVTPDGLMTGLRAGECNMVAEIVDGPTLRFKQMVVQIPSWLTHDDVSLKLNDEYPSLGAPMSDVGGVGDVTVEIEDTSIATYNGSLKLHNVGSTKVTMTAVKGGAQCSFMLTVLPPDDALYVRADGKMYSQADGYGMQVAYGYSKELPKITNYYGENVSVKWKITDYSTCSDHKNKAGFSLSGTTIRSSCYQCDCTVTATATSSGQTFEVDVSSFRLATQIGFTGIDYSLPVGFETTATAIVDMFGGGGYRLGEITWSVSNTSVLSIEEIDQYNHSATFKGLKPGKATVTAKLQNGVKGTFEINVISMPGDVDGNDKVDIIDALRVMQYEAGWGYLANQDNADVNDDGVINTADGELILRYVAGENVTLK